MEFGGPLGAFALMLWSHGVLYYFWYCYAKNQGGVAWPSMENWSGFVELFLEEGLPTWRTVIAYVVFIFGQVSVRLSICLCVCVLFERGKEKRECEEREREKSKNFDFSPFDSFHRYSLILS
jgi:hypothetical protein